MAKHTYLLDRGLHPFVSNFLFMKFKIYKNVSIKWGTHNPILSCGRVPLRWYLKHVLHKWHFLISGLFGILQVLEYNLIIAGFPAFRPVATLFVNARLRASNFIVMGWLNAPDEYVPGCIKCPFIFLSQVMYIWKHPFIFTINIMSHMSLLSFFWYKTFLT